MCAAQHNSVCCTTLQCVLHNITVCAAHYNSITVCSAQHKRVASRKNLQEKPSAKSSGKILSLRLQVLKSQSQRFNLFLADMYLVAPQQGILVIPGYVYVIYQFKVLVIV